MDKKKFIYGLLIILVLIVVSMSLPKLHSNKNISLGDNEILVDGYSYSYRKVLDSHQVRGEWESIDITHDNFSIKITSERTYPGPTYGKVSEEDNYTFRNDSPMNIYRFGDTIPSECSLEADSPDDFYSYGSLVLNCSSKIVISILNKDSFKSCTNSENCSLIYGEDILISN